MFFKNMSLFVCLSVSLLFSPCQAETSNSPKNISKFLISQPVLNLHESCSEESPYVSQGIYGHSVRLVKEMGNGWGLIETEDGYQGYALLEGLVQDDVRFRTSKRLVRVSSVGGMVYPIADTERPALMKLSFGSRVELIKDLESNEDRWQEVQLLDGRHAWMQRGDLEKFRVKTLNEVIQLAHKFLELPYIWGGTSSEGFDCSGYVQTLCKQMGLLIPRDSRPQAASEIFFAIDFPEQPGDILFFGESRITHVGLYLGGGKFIHAGVRDNKPKTTISDLGQTSYHLFATRKIKEISYQADIYPISEEIRAKMSYSWRTNNPVPLKNLRYIKLNHWGFDGCVHNGELVVHEKVANDIVAIFQELFEAKYPIEKMQLIDAYDANDDLACHDNNSSAFCSRPITGSTTEWSYHSYGLAVDINPLLNPYQKGSLVVPVIGHPFLDRTIDCYGIIDENDACYKAFTSRGWKWGGHWAQERGYVDYQHFYKEIAD